MRTLRSVSAVAVVAVAAVALPHFASPDSATVVILVRHAEKDRSVTDDPPLTPAGRERAERLVDAVAHADVQRIITTHYRRSVETIEPLAKRLGIDAIVMPRRTTLEQHIEDAVRLVREAAGMNVVLVGHSNTVPRIITALGGPPLPDIEDSSNSDFFVLVLEEGRSARLLHSRFGAEHQDGKTE